MAYISTKYMHYQKLPRSFFQEASTLEGNGVPFSAWKDGFTLVSQWTGETIEFLLQEVTRDREGEIVAWNYVPAEMDEPRVKSVIILND